MYLSQLRLENIRSFSVLDLSFVSEAGKPRPWTLILGDNSTGKTTVLRSIAIGLNDESSAAGLARELTGSLVQHDKKQGRIYCEVVDGTCKRTIITTIERVPRTGDRVRQKTFELPIKLLISRRRKARPSKRFPWHRLFLVGYGSGRNPDGRDEYDEYRAVDAVYTLFRYDQPLQSPELAWRRALDRARRAGNEASVGKRIRNLLRAVLMLEQEPDDIRLNDRIIITKHRTSTPLTDASDGYKSTATWTLDLIAWHLLFSPRARADSIRGIILLDEIEQHLHPRWQRYLVTRLKSAFPRVQFIGTTHSALCASGASDLTEADCGMFRMVFNLRKGITVEDLPLPRGLEADQILTSDAFSLPETRNPQLGEKVNHYRELIRKRHKTVADRHRLSRLRSDLRRAIPGGAQFEDELQLRNELRNLTCQLRHMIRPRPATAK